MSEEGISACYVNSHSFVHDIVTLSQVLAFVCTHACARAASWLRQGLPVLGTEDQEQSCYRRGRSVRLAAAS